MSDLQNEIKRLSNLRNYKSKDANEIEQIAQRNLWLKQINIEQRFKSTDDKKLATEQFESYLANYTFENFNDIQNVADLVFHEVTKLRIQQEISSITADENSKYVPDKMLESLHRIEEKVLDLKAKLGIAKTKEKDDLSALQMLQKKFEVYVNFNRNEFTLEVPFKCSGCGKEDVHPYLLRRRVKDFEVLKHPAFAGRFLYNKEIFDDIRKGLITKEQAARYLRTSSYYIDWVIKNENKIITISGVSQERIDEFVNQTPYLRNAEEYKEK